MLKKIGIPALALGAMMMLITPPRANAAVRFGVFIGGPVYGYPAYPVYPYVGSAYVYPYRYGYSYRYRPYWRSGYEYRGYRRHEWRDRCPNQFARPVRFHSQRQLRSGVVLRCDAG